MPVIYTTGGELTIGDLTVPVTASDWTFEVTNAGASATLSVRGGGGSGGSAYHDGCWGNTGYSYGGTGSTYLNLNAGSTYTLTLDWGQVRQQAEDARELAMAQAEAVHQQAEAMRAHHEARAEQDRLARERAAERQRAAILARERAERLLLSFLTPEQARTYLGDGFFLVTGSAGGHWRIRRDGQAGNVDLLTEDGQMEAWYCIHPPGCLPDADAHLAQMLHLVTDEEGFRRTANRHPVYRPEAPHGVLGRLRNLAAA